MTKPVCTEPDLSRDYHHFIEGGTVTIKYADGREVDIEYATSAEYLEGRMSPNNPAYGACVDLRTRFEKHQLSCEACRLERLRGFQGKTLTSEENMALLKRLGFYK